MWAFFVLIHPTAPWITIIYDSFFFAHTNCPHSSWVRLTFSMTIAKCWLYKTIYWSTKCKQFIRFFFQFPFWKVQFWLCFFFFFNMRKMHSFFSTNLIRWLLECTECSYAHLKSETTTKKSQPLFRCIAVESVDEIIKARKLQWITNERRKHTQVFYFRLAYFVCLHLCKIWVKLWNGNFLCVCSMSYVVRAHNSIEESTQTKEICWFRWWERLAVFFLVCNFIPSLFSLSVIMRVTWSFTLSLFRTSIS